MPKKILRTRPTIVQITANKYYVYALDDEGGLWVLAETLDKRYWSQLPSLPEQTIEEAVS